MVAVGQRAHQPLLRQTEPLADRVHRGGRDGHDAESAELDQHHDENLAGQGELFGDVEHAQTGHADRADGGEQLVDERNLRPDGGKGEVQQQRAEGAERQEGAEQCPAGMVQYQFPPVFARSRRPAETVQRDGHQQRDEQRHRPRPSRNQ